MSILGVDGKPFAESKSHLEQMPTKQLVAELEEITQWVEFAEMRRKTLDFLEDRMKTMAAGLAAEIATRTDA